MATTPNLFFRLHKWATRQDENFLTESLAVVLEHLLDLAPAVGVRMVSRLTGGFIDVPPDEAARVELQPQVEATTGRPDLEIRVPDRLCWIEVKAESELRAGQLEGYKVLLQKRGVEHTRLVLLTRYQEEFRPADAKPDLQVRWYEVADWLEAEMPSVLAAGEVAEFIGRQFIEFVEGRGMKLTQVGKFMPEGLRDLSSFLTLLLEAVNSCKVPVKKSATWEYIGAYLDKNKYWLGVNYTNPGKLWFNTLGRIDPEAARALGEGEVIEESGIPGRFRWKKSVELDSESVYFFSRSKVSQIEWIEHFLRDCLKKARSIETADQPPIPDDSEVS